MKSKNLLQKKGENKVRGIPSVIPDDVPRIRLSFVCSSRDPLQAKMDCKLIMMVCLMIIVNNALGRELLGQGERPAERFRRASMRVQACGHCVINSLTKAQREDKRYTQENVDLLCCKFKKCEEDCKGLKINDINNSRHKVTCKSSPCSFVRGSKEACGDCVVNSLTQAQREDKRFTQENVDLLCGKFKKCEEECRGLKINDINNSNHKVTCKPSASRASSESSESSAEHIQASTLLVTAVLLMYALVKP